MPIGEVGVISICIDLPILENHFWADRVFWLAKNIKGREESDVFCVVACNIDKLNNLL